MDDEERGDALQRLERMSALLAAKSRIEEVSRAVVDADTDDDAVAALADLLGCPATAARYLISTPLRHFRRPSVHQLENEIREMERSLDLRS
jgi:hypothetical protein